MGKLKNKSSVFILPMVMGIPYRYFSEFVNCYVGVNDDVYNQDKERIFIVFLKEDLEKEYFTTKKGDKITNSERMSIISGADNYLGVFEIGKFNIIAFRVPDIFKEDFNRFAKGRYSQFSETYKKVLKELYPNIKRIKSIIYPSDEDREKLAKELMCDFQQLKGREILSVPNITDEVFDIANFIEINV
jgi:hypothetical protein